MLFRERAKARRKGETPNIRDHALAGLGICLAIGSVAFAFSQMSGSDHPLPIAGSEHLLVFARPNTLPRPAAIFSTPGDGRAGVDRTAIGSIDAPAVHATRSDDRDGGPEMPGFTVHGVWKGAAIILGPGGLTSARVGAEIGNGAVVIAIFATRSGWRVATTQGVIRPPR